MHWAPFARRKTDLQLATCEAGAAIGADTRQPNRTATAIPQTENRVPHFVRLTTERCDQSHRMLHFRRACTGI